MYIYIYTYIYIYIHLYAYNPCFLNPQPSTGGDEMVPSAVAAVPDKASML